jgi:uncharacterized cofD-like protein
LYTSIIPNLLVAEIASAIRASTAPKIYICNVATQPGETDHYSLDDHIQAIEGHTHIIESSSYSDETGYSRYGQNLFSYVMANNNLSHPIPAAMNLQPILPAPSHDNSYQVIQANVVDDVYPWRHDPFKLADQLIKWYQQVASSKGGS